MRDIRAWFETPLGDHLLKTEAAILEQLLAGFFGYHLLQVSVQQSELFSASPIRHRICLGLDEQDQSSMLAKPTHLPLESDAIDVVLVHHLLDFVDSPQDALRELSRIVLPMGHLVIIGFNPFSLWGLCKPFAGLRKSPPWNGRFIRPGRLMDWMNLLNFKIDRAQFCNYGLPLSRQDAKIPDYSQGLSRGVNWPFGAAYIIVARKQVGTMTPIRPIWKSQQSFGRLAAVRPANRDLVSRDKFNSTET